MRIAIRRTLRELWRTIVGFFRSTAPTGRNRWDEYVRISVQYYSAAQHSAENGYSPVAGNLMHHAFEMLLKAGILKAEAAPKWQEPEKWLQRRFGHRLTKLWAELSLALDLGTVQFYRRHIKHLDLWEEVRYPGRRRSVGMYISYVALPDRLNVTPNTKVYRLEIPVLHSIFVELARIIGVNLDTFPDWSAAGPSGNVNTYTDQERTLRHA
jgi:hypothetical protein